MKTMAPFFGLQPIAIESGIYSVVAAVVVVGGKVAGWGRSAKARAAKVAEALA